MAPDVRKASGRDATSALRAPVSKQRPALFSAFNVAVVLAVIIAVALIANFNRAVEQASQTFARVGVVAELWVPRCRRHSRRLTA